MSDTGGVLFMPVALITVGGIMVYSALKGVGITDVFAGITGEKLDPKGGNLTPARSAAPGSGSAQGTPGAGGALGTPPLGGFTGGGSVGALEQELNRMISLRHPYKWGGGHQGFSQNGPWDCSGAVSWVAKFIGAPISAPMVSGQFARAGEAGRGRVFTIYANPAHVFIVMETGAYAGKSWGTTSRLASRGGSLAWHDHTKLGFVARHYPGW